MCSFKTLIIIRRFSTFSVARKKKKKVIMQNHVSIYGGLPKSLYFLIFIQRTDQAPGTPLGTIFFPHARNHNFSHLDIEKISNPRD